MLEAIIKNLKECIIVVFDIPYSFSDFKKSYAYFVLYSEEEKLCKYL